MLLGLKWNQQNQKLFYVFDVPREHAFFDCNPHLIPFCVGDVNSDIVSLLVSLFAIFCYNTLSGLTFCFVIESSLYKSRAHGYISLRSQSCRRWSTSGCSQLFWRFYLQLRQHMMTSSKTRSSWSSMMANQGVRNGKLTT